MEERYKHQGKAARLANRKRQANNRPKIEHLGMASDSSIKSLSNYSVSSVISVGLTVTEASKEFRDAATSTSPRFERRSNGLKQKVTRTGPPGLDLTNTHLAKNFLSSSPIKATLFEIEESNLQKEKSQLTKSQRRSLQKNTTKKAKFDANLRKLAEEEKKPSVALPKIDSQKLAEKANPLLAYLARNDKELQELDLPAYDADKQNRQDNLCSKTSTPRESSEDYSITDVSKLTRETPMRPSRTTTLTKTFTIGARSDYTLSSGDYHPNPFKNQSKTIQNNLQQQITTPSTLLTLTPNTKNKFNKNIKSWLDDNDFPTSDSEIYSKFSEMPDIDLLSSDSNFKSIKEKKSIEEAVRDMTQKITEDIHVNMIENGDINDRDHGDFNDLLQNLSKCEDYIDKSLCLSPTISLRFASPKKLLKKRNSLMSPSKIPVRKRSILGSVTGKKNVSEINN